MYLGRTIKSTLGGLRLILAHQVMSVPISWPKGSTLGTGNNGVIEIPLTVVKRDIDKFHYNKWKVAWLQYKFARQTKIWFQEPDQNKSKELLKLNRNKLSIVVQFTTGHNCLMRHSNLQDGKEDPYS